MKNTLTKPPVIPAEPLPFDKWLNVFGAKLGNTFKTFEKEQAGVLEEAKSILNNDDLDNDQTAYFHSKVIVDRWTIGGIFFAVIALVVFFTISNGG